MGLTKFTGKFHLSALPQCRSCQAQVEQQQQQSVGIDNDDRKTDWIWLDAIPAKVIHPPERTQADERKISSDHCPVCAG